MMNNGKDIEALKRAILKSKVNALLKQRETPHMHKGGVIPLADRRDVLPLSFAQQRLWFLCQLDSSASLAYHISATLKIKGKLERPHLVKAFNDVISRHESLRTRFVVINGVPCQKVDPINNTFSIEYHDLRTIDNKKHHKHIEALSNLEKFTPFDLSRGPLIRGRLLQLTDDENILILTQHHIISDGWSIEVLIDELGVLYSSACSGNNPHLTELPIQYADYAKWQQQYLSSENLSKSLDFWKTYLQGAPSLLALPTDKPRPNVQTFKGGQVPVQFDESLVYSLKRIGQNHGTTFFMTLLTGWSIVLSRLSGQKDIVIGTPIANRSQRELEGLIGFFVNTLALRINLHRCATVSDLLAEVRQQTLAAYTHQEAPFDKVVEQKQPERSSNYSPVFQVMLALNNTPKKHFELSGLDLSLIEQQQYSAHFDLTLSLAENAGKLAGYLEFSSDIFERSTGERIVSYLIHVLTEMIRDDSQNLQTLQIMPYAEYDQVTTGFNSTQTHFPCNKTVHTLFEEQALRTPQALAVVSEEASLTYDSLNRQANRLAHRLLALGIGPDDRVAVFMDRGHDTVVALLGVLKAGGAYVPLDPAAPRARLQYMLGDAAPVAIVTRRELLQELNSPLPVVLTDAPQPGAGGAEKESNPGTPGLTSRNLAYVIYTSGSTGQPKGVMVEHRSINRLVINNAIAHINSQDCVAHCANVAFDASTWEIWSALLNGAKLLVVSSAALLDPVRFSDTLLAGEVSALWLTSGLFNQYIDGLKPVFRQLRYLLVGGEALDPRKISQLQQSASQPAQLINGYGPTETTTFAASYLIDSPVSPSRSIPIGKPISNTRIYILDDHGQVVPVGVPGELHIAGDGVARGYLNLPEMTASRFLDDPFSPLAAQRMYRTGDLGRWLPDGNIEYLGRNDFQVKIRGFRIEPGEIEACLTACDDVREAVVVAREDVPGDRRLVAYLIPEDGCVPEPAALRLQLSRSLAEYMLPAAFVVVSTFPLTPNGKLDRRALPAPDRSAVASRGYAAPLGDTETALAAVWCELLGVTQVGRHDNFFELGGHSLMMVSLLDRLRILGWSLDIRSAYSATTLADMALCVTLQHSGAAEVPPHMIPEGSAAISPDMLPLITLSQHEIDTVVATVCGGAANVQDIYPLSPLQEGILFHHLLQEQGDTYLLHSLMAFDSRGHLEAFIQALQFVIDRHDILRTSVCSQGVSRPVQVVWRRAVLQVNSFESGNADDRLSSLREHINPRQRRISLEKAPLFSADCVYDPGRQQWLLGLCFHHMVCDHITMALICDEITRVLQGNGSALPAPRPYRDFIAQLICTPEAAHEEYFRSRLAGIDTPTAPFGILDVQESGGRTAEASLTLDALLAGRIQAGARGLGVTPGILFHAACARMLAQLCGRDDVVFGTVLMGRLQAGRSAEGGLGMFINTLPLCLSLAGYTAREAILATARELATLLEHEQAPLALALRCSGVAAPLPLFSTLLNYRHSLPGGGADSWQGMHLLEAEERTNYPLTLSVDDTGDSFILTAQTVTGISPGRILSYMRTAMEGLVNALGREPESPFSRVAILPPDERRLLLETFNAPRQDYPHDSLVHVLFEEQALRTPQALAVVSEEASLTYDSLNRQANRLAHRLLALGIGPDDRVAVFMDRGHDTVVALLGVLKAGGAYVPLDPAAPRARLQYMLGDAAPVAIVTRRELLQELNSPLPVVLTDAPQPGAGGAEKESNPGTPGLTSRNLAYVIYTSGSTGQPKGVMVEHRSVLSLLNAMQEKLELKQPLRITMNASIVFDASVQCWIQLLLGHTLVLIPEALRTDGKQLLQFLIKHRVNVLDCTPVQLQWLLDAGIGESHRYPQLILVGGDALSNSMWASLQKKKNIKFANVYGPTECTVNASCCFINNHLDKASIGRPLANNSIYILDEHRELVPVGVPGELYIAGDGVARGYLNLPEMTASRFLDDPFSPLAAQRMYRTGDLGRWLPDGNIEYLGRNDFQVKIRGFRIEPGEIEACLTACDDVREAVVVAREDVPGDRRLVAYLIPEDGCVPEPAALRLQLSRSLAEYMLPAAFVVVSTFPLTPNGKLDRRALPAPDRSAVASRGYAAPLGDTETALAAVWCELLGVTQVGRHDNFFELGGHSLIAVKLLTQMSRAGLKTTLPTLYKNSTLCQLAEAIDKPGDIAISLFEDNPIPLKLSGNEAPLFLLHEPSGDPLVYSALAEKLNLNRPVYALQAIGLHTLTPSPGTLEELGNYHLQAIRKVQSTGPYYLAGWSLGGVLSYEIATQLAKMGEKVAYIGMIDSYNPNFIKNNTLGKSYENSIKDEMILRFVNKFVPNNQKNILCECSRPIDAKKIFDLGLHHQWFPSNFSFDDLMLRLNTALYLRTLGLNYVPIYSGLNVEIYIAEDGGEKDLWRGWQQLVGIESSIHIIGGTHYSIMQMPLLESLAKKISSKLSPYENYNPLVTLSDGIVGEPPIFCIPGAGASAISFFEFANAILYKGPVYAFQARGLDDSNIKPYQTIQETATDYIKAMVKNYPSGPYRLIGHSFGGWIAFEMALQLHASGKVVSEVVILDSRVPGVRIKEDKLLGSTDTIIKLINIYNLTLEEPLPISGDEIINLERKEQVNLLYKALIQCGVFTKKTPTSSLERILDVMQKNINTHYSPSSSYSGKVLLINAKDSDIKARKRNEKHWKKYAYKLELMKSDGNHMTMLKKPNITSLIRMLRDVYS